MILREISVAETTLAPLAEESLLVALTINEGRAKKSAEFLALAMMMGRVNVLVALQFEIYYLYSLALTHETRFLELTNRPTRYSA